MSHHSHATVVDESDSKSRKTSFADIFMNLATNLTSRSGDRETRVGCVITNFYNQILGVGYNGEAKGTSETVANEGKDHFMVHAEMNAIAHASGNLSRENLIVFTTRIPCFQCMKMLSQFNTICIFYLFDCKSTETKRLAKNKNMILLPFHAVFAHSIPSEILINDETFRFESKHHEEYVTQQNGYRTYPLPVGFFNPEEAGDAAGHSQTNQDGEISLNFVTIELIFAVLHVRKSHVRPPFTDVFGNDVSLPTPSRRSPPHGKRRRKAYRTRRLSFSDDIE